MIAVLPLRGWAGEIMSVEMAAGAVASHAGASHAEVPHAVDAMPPDCPMHAQMDTNTSSDSSAGMQGCMSCGLCIPMTEPAIPSVDTGSFGAYALPAAVGVRFASAVRALPLKPPIS